MTQDATTAAAPPAAPMKVAVVFGYNGMGFAGLDRHEAKKPSSPQSPEPRKKEESVESVLLNAFVMAATGNVHCKEPVKITNISRASVTYRDEHAARQTLSFEMSCSTAALAMPTPSDLNKILPESIRVFSIINPTPGFSARRICDARTYEFLIPTYAFAPPPPETGYANPPRHELTKEEIDSLYPDASPETEASGQASLFTTLKRATSVMGRKSISSPRDFPHHQYQQQQHHVQHATLSPPKHKNQTHAFSKSLPQTSSGNFFSKIFEAFKKNRKHEPSLPEASPLPAKNLPHITNSSYTLVRSRSRSAPPLPTDHEDGSSSTLFTPSGYTANGSGPKIYDPIRLGELTERDRDALRRYRATAEQLSTLKSIIGLYRGTHNWHNFVGGEVNEAFMRILNIECAEPEIHAGGLEWVRIKIQASSFSVHQIRRMMSFIIMVIRTNTPQSVVSAAFGLNKMEVPIAPAFGLIFDQPLYEEYNRMCMSTRNPGAQILFDEEKAEIEAFRKSHIHNAVYTHESLHFNFAEWLRQIDMFAFLYTHYLNPRGIVYVQNAACSLAGVDEKAIYEVY